jgi:hypothetical protein
MEGGLHQPPLAQMEGTLARQQPVAQKRLRPLETTALCKIPMVRNEHISDVRRMVGEEDPLPAHLV